MCACTRSQALKLEKEIDREMDALGLFTNSKRQAPSREGEFIGLNYDTADCLFTGELPHRSCLACQSWQVSRPP